MKTSRWIALPLLSLAIGLPALCIAADTANPAVIEIHARKFEFVPAQVTLKKDTPVKLRFISDDVAHSLVVPGLHINQLMKAGETAEVTITPSETGDFPGVCGKYCGDGHVKMQFVVHVVAAK